MALHDHRTLSYVNEIKLTIFQFRARGAKALSENTTSHFNIFVCRREEINICCSEIAQIGSSEYYVYL